MLIVAITLGKKLKLAVLLRHCALLGHPLSKPQGSARVEVLGVNLKFLLVELKSLVCLENSTSLQ